MQCVNIYLSKNIYSCFPERKNSEQINYYNFINVFILMKEKSDTTLDFLEYACFLDLTTEANIFHKYTHTKKI